MSVHCGHPHHDVIVIITEVHGETRKNRLDGGRRGDDSTHVGNPVIPSIEPPTVICGESPRAVSGLGSVHGNGSPSGLRGGGGVVDDVMNAGIAVHGSNRIPRAASATLAGSG